MFTLKKQIDLTLQEHSINLIEIKDPEKSSILHKIKETFVQGNPRALWLGFKYHPDSIKYEGDYPHIKLPDLVPPEEEMFFLIDDFNEVFYLYKGKIAPIITFIEECVGLDEYYLVNYDISQLICETDHGDLLYIDIHKNKLR